MSDPTKIPALSPAMSELLGKLGMNKHAFQQSVAKNVAAKLLRGTNKRNSTERGNRTYYERTSRIEAIRDAAERAVANAPKPRIPLAYLMFQRNSRCAACGSKECCMDASQIFLVETDAPGSPTRMYHPVQSMDAALPHWIKEVDVETLACIACWTAVQEPAPQTAIAPSAPVEGASCPA